MCVNIKQTSKSGELKQVDAGGEAPLPARRGDWADSLLSPVHEKIKRGMDR
jgi:hypothetical protein